jgi:hypothetical protein
MARRTRHLTPTGAFHINPVILRAAKYCFKLIPLAHDLCTIWLNKSHGYLVEAFGSPRKLSRKRLEHFFENRFLNEETTNTRNYVKNRYTYASHDNTRKLKSTLLTDSSFVARSHERRLGLMEFHYFELTFR